MSKSRQYASMDVEEGQNLLQSNNREEEARKLRKNLIIWSGLGGLLVLFIVLAAVTSGRKDSEDDDPRSILGGDPAVQLDKVSDKSPGLSFDFGGRPRAITAKQAAVAADSGRCSDIGIKVLKDKGNAVDAAVATALCSGVVNPFGSGIGGGAFINIHMADGRAVTINSREQAPLAATPDMYAGKPGNASSYGGLAIAVPMELKGLYLAWTNFGSKALSWYRLVRPAAIIAERGFAAHPELVSMMRDGNNTRYVLDTPLLREWLAVMDKESNQWRLPEVGEHCCRNPKLASTLSEVAERGIDWLYSGDSAEVLAAEIQAAGGIITAAELTSAQPRLQGTFSATIAGKTYHTMPPPSSAATALAALQLLHGFPSLTNDSDPLLVHHRVVECTKHAFGMRLSMGDPGLNTSSEQYAAIKALLADIMNKTFIDELRSNTSDAHVLNINEYGGHWNTFEAPSEDHGTSHMSVLDEQGNAVALTSSINKAFGSLVVSPSTGMLLNNHMDDFDVASVRNGIQPGKIPKSSMSPTIVVDETGQVRQVVGASGGFRILSSVIQVLARQQLLGKSAWDAVSTPKVHHQLKYNDSVVMLWESGSKFSMNITVNQTILDYLTQKGNVPQAYSMFQTEGLGVVQNIFVDGSGVISAVSDPRKDGAPAGY